MRSFYICCLLHFVSAALYAQPGSTLEHLYEQSRLYYASNKAAGHRTVAAEAQASIIKDQFKPQLTAAYQLNYATYNNITGMVFPSFITPISGPPASSNSYNGVFGSAAALLAKWDVATFGYQKALLQQATSNMELFKARDQLQQFRQNVQLSSTYLDWLLASRLISVYDNNVYRAKTLFEQSQILAINGLKPGTDSSSLSSEYLKAKIFLEQQRQFTATTFIQLQQLIGVDTFFTASDTLLLNKLPVLLQPADSLLHPELAVLQKEIEKQNQEINVLQQSQKPLLSLYGTGYARGSGIEANNDIKSLQGLYFQRYNYGLGVQLSVPLFEASKTKAKLAKQQQLVNAASEDYAAMQWQLEKQIQEADTTLQRAINIVSITQSQQQSSAFLFNAVAARYKAGLVSYADVVLAQQQLVQAEADVQKSRWEVWKALLYKATVLGNLKFFTQQFR